ncbi:MAG TPA: DivIVA domain-containing protein [Nocardioidaceae bacterium]|nr:DivIVA domain-containing protein [Nocardioidaceae bacterium]
MIWLFAIVVVLVIGGLVTLAVVRGEQAQPAYDDRPEVRLPAERPLRSDDLSTVRFTTVARGYRMAEVDALLARLRAEMAEREAGQVQPVDPDDVTAPLRAEPTDPELTNRAPADPTPDDADGD